MIRKWTLASLSGALALGGLTNCSDTAPVTEEAPAEVAATSASLESLSASAGKRLFTQAFPHTNGRSCATCHVLEDSTALLPSRVESLLATHPEDPLFNRLDADDPDAAVPTYEHLKKGLVRVVLPLPDNMDVIDTQGNVITRPDREVFVWRGVPSIEDTAITGPFQLDGRETSLETQAQSAITSHSEGGAVSRADLKRLADFERSRFTSARAWFVSSLLDSGVPVSEIPSPEDFMVLSARERRGREVYEAACAACHGGATTTRITDRDVHDALFLALKPDGNVRFTHVPGQGPVPELEPRPNNEFLNLGFGLLSYLGQVGLATTYTSSVELPRYRFRFYTDGTRQQVLTELPPIPRTASGDPFDPNPALDEHGAPLVGPNFFPQWFSTDPGRALITGDPADFEAFDLPSLRGVARTAPYFHDNSHETLEDVVDFYSQFVVGLFPTLELPPIHPPETPGGRPEALSPQQKQDLLAFLNRL